VTSLLETFTKVRARSEEICQPLAPEDYNAQVVLHASPAKWQLGHTTWFYEEFILSQYLSGYKRFSEDCAFIFNSYYNNVGDRTQRDKRGEIDISVEEIYAYRKYVDEHMNLLLESVFSKEITGLFEVGLNHEQQHQELLITDLKFNLSEKKPDGIHKLNGALINSENLEDGWVTMPNGVYEIGFEGEGFCFDNELTRHKVYLHDFEISKSLITNGEFIEFIENDGYQDFNFWLDEGWIWVQKNKIESPLYWKKVDGEWHHFTLGGSMKVDPRAILCHVSFYEAAAFAAWKGFRLPTEFEWEAASKQLAHGQRWEWTNSAYLPYPGYRKALGAIGEYNGKFMINQMVLRGGSVATPNGHCRNTYRNFFHPHFQWQFSGIRLAR
jgi:ergothioneine biosynthesis protein EgtB